MDLKALIGALLLLYQLFHNSLLAIFPTFLQMCGVDGFAARPLVLYAWLKNSYQWTCAEELLARPSILCPLENLSAQR